jgi:hypothetical protein
MLDDQSLMSRRSRESGIVDLQKARYLRGYPDKRVLGGDTISLAVENLCPSFVDNS